MERAEKLQGLVGFQLFSMLKTILTGLLLKTGQFQALTAFNSDSNRPSIVVESVVADHGAEIDEGLDAIGKD